MPEDLVVDLPDTGDSVEVEIEPLEAAPGEEAMEAPEEEHLEYSKKVKRRIDKLTKKAREMERQFETWTKGTLPNTETGLPHNRNR